jgi:WD40 repeat protein
VYAGSGTAASAGLTFDRTGRLLVWHGQVWDTVSGRLVKTFPATHAALGPEGKRLIGVGPDHRVCVWDFGSGAEVCALGQVPPDAYRLVASDRERWLATGKKVAFSGDGRRLVCSSGSTAVVFDLRTGREECRLAKAGYAMQAAAFSPDGSTVALGTREDVRVWALATGRLVTTLTSDASRVATALAFSADGKRLAAGGVHERTVRVWETEAWEEVLRFDCLLSGTPSALAFAPDGRSLAARLASGNRVRVWGELAAPAAGAER